ncbi:MAG: D-alanyl-D-alanine carboxypeptidase [Rhodospirillales bacterium]|nr:D-alanyl-D-alanine carboxypeptidase [Rhodospirillales bacterium]MCB9997222.1 D-alanyl-D-alanine carboxypeptidase [Rhodospirillales bacterium]
MKNTKLKRAAAALGLGFLLAATPAAADYDYAARNSEPSSCKIGGKVFAPESASIVIDAQNGSILAGEHIDSLRHPASMTKMMTAALIFDALRDGRLKLDDKITVTISKDMLATRGNSRSTWLYTGEKVTVEEALLAITVASANNVSVMMAEKIAGSEVEFVKLMNEKAKKIGMGKTVFKNSTGLPDKDQVSTARDMAKLALHIYKTYPEYYHIFSAPKAEFGSWRGKRAKHNHNAMAVNNQDIDGLKTGFICDSGYNLAASAVDGKYRAISIVFGGRTPYLRNQQTAKLLQEGLSQIHARATGNSAVATLGLGYIRDDETTDVANLKNRLNDGIIKPPLL